jgi:phage host-nuclease inhibitor protein Gam
MKKTKYQPILISSREAMLAVVSELVQAKLAHAALTVQVEEQKAMIEEEYQPDFDKMQRSIQSREAALEVWAAQHPEEFGDKKSLDLPQARFGFRTGKHKVGKIRTKDTWDAIAERLASFVSEQLIGENYVRYGGPEVDKDKLLADRKTLAEDALKAVGIRFEQDEFFFFEPKSEVLEATSKVA